MSKSFKTNAVRGPINAWIFKALAGYMDRLFGSTKRKLFKDHPGTIVEIGPGAGANMRYYRPGTRVIAIEPNSHMHPNLRKTATKYGMHLKLKSLAGEAIDLPDNSFDFVVCTLVLCSVEEPLICLQQIKRILKPSGTFVFLEHVKAPEKSVLAFIQNLIHQPWYWFFEGCHTNRDTGLLLHAAGFSHLELQEYNLYSPFIPIIPQICGKAIK